MSTLGTFDTFTSARLGIYAAQIGLQVTGNNISNINTTGYTRQRIDQVSLKTGVYDRYRSMMDNHVGSGALVSGISQIRDPYLDIRYRDCATNTAYYDTKLAGLEEIATILDEVGKGTGDKEGDGLLFSQLQDLASKLRAYSANPTRDNEILVRGSATALTSLFNNYAGRLEKVRQDTEKEFNDNITAVNKILENIRDLNQSIRECEINGDNALEMRDERNRQIDALSKYTSIKVQYSMEDVGAGIKVEKLTILMGDSNPDPSVQSDSSILVDGIYCTQLSVPEEKPLINPYFASQDPQYAAIKDYMYLKTVDPTQLPQGVTTADVVEIADPNDPTGTRKISVIGTNSVEEADPEPNDNYSIKLGKLLDEFNNEWTSAETVWTTLAPGAHGSVVGQKAVYESTVTTQPDQWQKGDKFIIAGKEYVVGTNLPLSTVQDSKTLALFIADKLNEDSLHNENSDYKGYTVTSKGDKLIFTAREPGAIGGNGPAKVPDPDVTNGGTKISITTPVETSQGVDSQKPQTGTGPNDLPQEGSTFDPVTGDEVTISYSEINGAWHQITVKTKHTSEIVLDSNDLHGELQAQRELLTGEGEFASQKDVLVDENAAIKRGIPYYQKSFDLLAQKFAEAYNELNTGFMLNQNGNYVDEQGKELEFTITDAGNNQYQLGPINKYDGLTDDQAQMIIDGGFILRDKDNNPILDKDGNEQADLDALLIDAGFVLQDADGNAILDKDGKQQADFDAWVEDNGGVSMGGPLFSNRNDRNDTTGITAANISISSDWSHGKVQLVPKFEVLFGGEVENTTQNTNADHMVSMIENSLEYNPADLNGSDAIGPLLFTGSFNDMFSNIMSVQATDANITSVKLSTSATSQVQLDAAREGVSGVDLNDEAMNMMQYQKAMNAAMRLMTAVDEALDRLINNTGLAGR